MAFRPTQRSNDPKHRIYANDGNESFAGFINPSTGEEVRPSEGYAVPTVYEAPADGLTVEVGDLVRLINDELIVPTDPFTNFFGVVVEDYEGGPSNIFAEKSGVLGVTPLKQNMEGDNPVTRILFATKDVNDAEPLSLYEGRRVQVVQSSGEWGIDVEATENPHVRIEKVDPVRREFLVRFLDSAIQSSA